MAGVTIEGRTGEQMPGTHGAAWRRGTTLAGLSLLLLAVGLGGGAGGADARRSEAAAPEAVAPPPEDTVLRAAYERFAPIAIDDALMAQPGRIAAQVAALPAHPASPETLVLAVGGEGYLAIFDREARRAAAVLAARGTGPSLVLSNTPGQAKSGIMASPATVAMTLAAIGKRARPGDLLVVYLTSHGSPEAFISMDAPRFDFGPLRASRLAQALDNAGLTRRIVIISACYAGSWIEPLANPTTIVVAAAAADRTSFGCDDSRDLTLFGESLLGELAHTELSLATAFARAKARVAASERAQQITPSLPQARVGAEMQGVWTEGATTGGRSRDQ